MHVVCPKFLAFKGPLRPGHPCKHDGEVALPAGHYAKMFRTMGVCAVVRVFSRLNFNPPAPRLLPLLPLVPLHLFCYVLSFVASAGGWMNSTSVAAHRKGPCFFDWMFHCHRYMSVWFGEGAGLSVLCF